MDKKRRREQEHADELTLTPIEGNSKRFKMMSPDMSILQTPAFKLTYADEYDNQEEQSLFSKPVTTMEQQQKKRLLYTPRKLAEKIKKQQVPKLTIPKSPALRCDKRVKSRADRTIVLDVSKAVTKKRILNARRHGHTHIGRSHHAMMRRELTHPVEFNFRTDHRLRHNHHHEEHVHRHQEEPNEWHPTLTHPKPFTFHTSNRVKPTDVPDASPYKSIAERLKEFDTTFKQIEVAEKPMGLTRPAPFNFQTGTRYRPVHVLSTEEQKRIELENMPKFKARPLPKKIFESHGDMGVPKIEKRPLTEAEAPNLRSLTRFEARKRLRSEQDEMELERRRERKRQFKARCLNSKILSGETVLPPVEHRPSTIPESPALSTKQRGLAYKEQFEQKMRELQHEQEEAKKFKARPMPDGQLRLAPKQALPLTDPAPFSLATNVRGAHHEQELAAKLETQAREEREKRQFKAQPIKIYEDASSASVEPRKLTNPAPFNLKTELRGATYQEVFEQENRSEPAQFKARPMPSSDKPFVPSKSDKPLTELANFNLQSDRRAVARSEFDVRMKKKMAEIEVMQRQREEDEKKMEEQKNEQARRDIEAHLKAKPMPAFYSNYSKDHLSLVEKRLQKRLQRQRENLTVPKTPNFATHKRLGRPGAIQSFR
jgi:targeting protein for Xklp2